MRVLTYILGISLFLVVSCSSDQKNIRIVHNKTELDSAISQAVAGEEIVLANRVWKDVEINFSGEGTAEKPIVLKAETPGEVFIEGKSCIRFSGSYLTVQGLYFRKGYTPDDAVILFRNGEKVADHCTFTQSVIEHFNQPHRDRADHWVEFWGRNNELSYCNLIGKSNSGPTVRIMLKGNESVNNHHRIVFNHFGPRPRKGGPHGETIQLGDSGTSMCPGYTLVAYNFFDRCNGEVEVISSKSNFNEFRNNVFYKCEGSLVTRHGNYCIIDGNYFIGDSTSSFIGGIRLINTGHWVINNYFYQINGDQFRSALAVMNGIPKSPLNRYNQVTDVVVAYNTWIECKIPWKFGVGANLDQREVLPPSEIRSARPVRTVVANNVVYTSDPENQPIRAYDKIDGILFRSNVINQKTLAEAFSKQFDYCAFELKSLTEYLKVPTGELATVVPYEGFEFDKILTDILGHVRTSNNQVGAFVPADWQDPQILDSDKYGCSWWRKEANTSSGELRLVQASSDLAVEVQKAESRDTLLLESGIYTVSNSIAIDKLVILKAKENADVTVVYEGADGTPLFLTKPFGEITLQGIRLKGSGKNWMVAPLANGMSEHYQLTVKSCRIQNFDYVVLAHKETFADRVIFRKSELMNCGHGIVLAAETDDKGDYNAEFLVVEDCRFENIASDVLNFYRGGYDESTIGGNLVVRNCTFVRCGEQEKSGVLLKHRGIVNVSLEDNVFRNNPVKRVAVLWGAKNNSQTRNEVQNSGRFEVQQNISLRLMY